VRATPTSSYSHAFEERYHIIHPPHHKICLCRLLQRASLQDIVAWLAGWLAGWYCFFQDPIVDESRSFDCFYRLRLYQLLHCTFLLIHILYIYICGLLLWFLGRGRFLLIKSTARRSTPPLMIASQLDKLPTIITIAKMFHIKI
jgi:hypothetical protein